MILAAGGISRISPPPSPKDGGATPQDHDLRLEYQPAEAVR
jgi:hypothetical protein